MYCSKCGTQLPSESNFCFNCGTPQKADVSGAKPQWETCIIETDYNVGGFFSSKVKIVAKATGPKGTYIAASSPALKLGDNKKWIRLQDALKAELLANGWEPVDNENFRRIVS